MRKAGFSLSPVTILNAAAGVDAAQEALGIPFGSTGRRLDVYHPRTDGAHPVVAFFYGGGWESGARSMYRFVGRALAAAGVVTVIADYRVYPEVKFPAFVTDAAEAVRWTHDHADRFGGDRRQLMLMGHSAGAHIAAMLTFDRQWLGAAGLDPAAVRGLVGLAGPYDFLPLHSDVLRAIFGPEAGLAATQPINFVDGRACPALLITGSDDRVVDPGNSARLAQRIVGMGGVARLVTYPRLGHEALIGAFASPLRWLAPVRRDCLAFINGSAVPTLAATHEAAA